MPVSRFRPVMANVDSTSGCLRRIALNLLGHRFGALQRRAHRQGHQADQITLVLVRHEAGRPGVQQPQCGHGEDQKDRHRSHTAADGGAAPADVARGEAA